MNLNELQSLNIREVTELAQKLNKKDMIEPILSIITLPLCGLICWIVILVIEIKDK